MLMLPRGSNPSTCCLLKSLLHKYNHGRFGAAMALRNLWVPLKIFNLICFLCDLGSFSLQRFKWYFLKLHRSSTKVSTVCLYIIVFLSYNNNISVCKSYKSLCQHYWPVTVALKLLSSSSLRFSNISLSLIWFKRPMMTLWEVVRWSSPAVTALTTACCQLCSMSASIVCNKPTKISLIYTVVWH